MLTSPGIGERFSECQESVSQLDTVNTIDGNPDFLNSPQCRVNRKKTEECLILTSDGEPAKFVQLSWGIELYDPKQEMNCPVFC